MKIAGLSLLRWAAEANAQLRGINCRRVLAYDETSTLVLHLVGRRDRFLLLPNGPTAAYPCFFQDKKQLAALGERQPTEKFNRLSSRRLSAISGHPGDRRITFHFTPRPDKPPDDELTLVVHLMGPKPLCLLLDAQGRISETNRPTERYPKGETYNPISPPGLADLLTITFPEFLRLWRSFDPEPLTVLLRRRVWGIDDELAAVLVSAAGGKPLRPDLPDRALWDAFAQIKSKSRRFLTLSSRIRTDADTGTIVDWTGDDATQTGSSLNELFCARLLDHLQEDRQKKTRELWRKFATARLKKCTKARMALEARRKEAERAEQFKECADILNIHRRRIKKGTDKVELPNPYDDNRPLMISLNPAKSVQQNIESYYKKHRRALSSRTALAAEDARLKTARRLAEKILEHVNTVNPDEFPYPVDRWREKLREMGIKPPPAASSGTRVKLGRRLPYREFKLEGGAIIWVGRSARENDELTLRQATRTDWFLHARQSKGAHVILKHGRAASPPSAQALRRAAGVAAFFSEAKHSSVVPVACTAVKYVRKPRKAPPGRVTLLREETIMATPSPPPGYHARADFS